MSFTDKDISAMLMDAEDQIEMNGTYEIDGKDFHALIARLEAAEKLIAKYGAPEEGWAGEGLCDAYDEWLSRAGRAQGAAAQRRPAANEERRSAAAADGVGMKGKL